MRSIVKKILVFSGIVVSTQGCSLSDLINVDDNPPGSTVDRTIIESFAGARGAYYSAVERLTIAMSDVSLEVAQFTDELTVAQGRPYGEIERRRPPDLLNADPSVAGGSYRFLQRARVSAQQATDLLRRFGGDDGKNLLAHSYALEAYSIIMLGEMMCSGIPLSHAPYGGRLEYGSGLTTEQVFNQALLLLDTGNMVNADSVPVLTLLRIARGRALLNLGRYAEAAEAVQAVATDHRSTISFASQGFEGSAEGTFWTRNDSSYMRYTLSNSRGINGLRWLADSAVNQDPRVPVTRTPDRMSYVVPIRQTKFPSAVVNMTIASGVEARLIEAEAMLNEAGQSGNWLQIINDLRRQNNLTGLPTAISDTTDPGSQDSRVNLLFRERAYWFFLDGHRLGDMRRLIRQYRRLPHSVFPVGPIGGSGGSLTYGNEYVFIPEKIGVEVELETNPNYKGCYDRNP